MYYETIKKKFIADTSARIMATLMGGYSLGLSDELLSELAQHSLNAAVALADKLTDYWGADGDQCTTFFDPSDTLYTRIEEALQDISDKLNRRE